MHYNISLTHLLPSVHLFLKYVHVVAICETKCVQQLKVELVHQSQSHCHSLSFNKHMSLSWVVLTVFVDAELIGLINRRIAEGSIDSELYRQTDSESTLEIVRHFFSLLVTFSQIWTSLKIKWFSPDQEDHSNLAKNAAICSVSIPRIYTCFRYTSAVSMWKWDIKI